MTTNTTDFPLSPGETYDFKEEDIVFKAINLSDKKRRISVKIE